MHHEGNTPSTDNARVHDWFDLPNPNPKRRKTMEQLLQELATRDGDPVFTVHPAGHRAPPQITYMDVIDGLHQLARDVRQVDPS